jgi:hypothetical protein
MYIRVAVQLLIMLILLCQLLVPALQAQDLTECEKQFVYGTLPQESLEVIPQSAEQLIAAGADLTHASNRKAHEDSCSINRELVGLGASLQKVSVALNWLEPALLKQEPVSLSDLWNIMNRNPAASKAGRALVDNVQRLHTYCGALDGIAEAGRKLTLLDPVGSSGPPAETTQLLTQAAQSLGDLDEQSGIWVHLKDLAQSMAMFQDAKLRYHKPGCENSARLMGQMTGLAGQNLAGLASVVQQSGASSMLGLSLYGMSQSMPSPSLAELDNALDLYAKSLLQLAESLSTRAAIARSVNLASEPVSGASFQQIAEEFDKQADALRTTAEHIAQARGVLDGAAAAPIPVDVLGRTLRSGGAMLKESGVFASVVETGDALLRAGKLLGDQQPQSAAKVLEEASSRVLAAEQSLVRTKP